MKNRLGIVLSVMAALLLRDARALACKPCDPDHLAYSLRNADTIVYGRILGSRPLQEPATHTEKLVEYEIETRTVLRGISSAKVIKLRSASAGMCVAEPWTPPEGKRDFVFFASGAYVMAYCGLGALEVEGEKRVLMPEDPPYKGGWLSIPEFKKRYIKPQ